jgi:acetylornithine deacetylase/succinyl-diaminopimelate desuccinylase family protein
VNEARFEHPGFVKAEEQIRRSRGIAVELLEELMRIATANPPGEHYLECALLLAERLRDLGFAPTLHEVPPSELQRLGLPPYAPRPSVLAVLGSEREDSPILHFHGHYDVVPAESPDDFRLRVQGDVARGRGAADMKGGLVSMLLAGAALLPLKGCLRGRICLSIVPDEETGGEAGTAHLLRSGALPRGGIGMLMPEPTGSVIWNGSRGALSLRLKVLGRMAHVALQHQGRNAFEGMLELGDMLRELRREVETRDFGEDALGLEGPPSILLIGGTCNGGMNFNVVPEEMAFSIDRRFHPRESGEQVEKELDVIFRRFRRRGWRLKIERLQRGDASFTPATGAFPQALEEAVRSVTGKAPRFVLCPGILETRFFLQHGIPGLAYGPGELEVSHGPDECVSLSRVLEVARVYARTAWRLLGPKHDSSGRES